MASTPVKIYECGNCGGRHWGYYEDYTDGDYNTFWEFVATFRDGSIRTHKNPDGSVDNWRNGWSPCL